MNPLIDNYLHNAKKWQKELKLLRSIILDCGLEEELKWRQPCYTYRDSNILIVGEFKEFCVITFFKGALMDDSESILKKPGENTQAARTIRFTSSEEIIELEKTLRSYIFEAIEIEKAGLKVELKSNYEIVFVEELQSKIDNSSEFKQAFAALTPGRQRAYNMLISEAKQSKTRESRIENFLPRIFAGKGYNDCICGLSKRMPNCDGSHKFQKT